MNFNLIKQAVISKLSGTQREARLSNALVRKRQRHGANMEEGPDGYSRYMDPNVERYMNDLRDRDFKEYQKIKARDRRARRPIRGGITEALEAKKKKGIIPDWYTKEMFPKDIAEGSSSSARKKRRKFKDVVGRAPSTGKAAKMRDEYRRKSAPKPAEGIASSVDKLRRIQNRRKPFIGRIKSFIRNKLR